MNEESMGKITIKLSNDAEKLLRERAERDQFLKKLNLSLRL